MPSGFTAATNPSKIYPTCAIEEYASSRLIFVCVIAASVPTVSESTPTASMIRTQSRFTGQKTVRNNRSSSAKLAAFEATLTYAVIDVGAPS